MLNLANRLITQPTEPKASIRIVTVPARHQFQHPGSHPPKLNFSDTANLGYQERLKRQKYFQETGSAVSGQPQLSHQKAPLRVFADLCEDPEKCWSRGDKARAEIPVAKKRWNGLDRAAAELPSRVLYVDFIQGVENQAPPTSAPLNGPDEWPRVGEGSTDHSMVRL